MTFKRARTNAKLSQKELADASGVWQQTISLIERGLTKDPSHRTVMALCRALGVDPQDIDEFANGGRR